MAINMHICQHVKYMNMHMNMHMYMYVSLNGLLTLLAVIY